MGLYPENLKKQIGKNLSVDRCGGREEQNHESTRINTNGEGTIKHGDTGETGKDKALVKN